MDTVDERRWYKRQTCDFLADVTSPCLIHGRVVNLSDGGLMITVFPEGEHPALENGTQVELIVKVEDGFHLSKRQKVHGLIRRVKFDVSTSNWYAAIEVTGAWEDI